MSGREVYGIVHVIPWRLRDQYGDGGSHEAQRQGSTCDATKRCLNLWVDQSKVYNWDKNLMLDSEFKLYIHSKTCLTILLLAL